MRTAAVDLQIVISLDLAFRAQDLLENEARTCRSTVRARERELGSATTDAEREEIGESLRFWQEQVERSQSDLAEIESALRSATRRSA